MQTAPRPKRDTSERGNELIEVSFIVLPFFGFLFLILDLSMGLYAYCSLQHAVAEGVRYGITSQTDPGKGMDSSIRTRVIRQSMGALKDNDDDRAKIQIRFYNRTTLELIDEATAGAAIAGANAEGNILEIAVEGYNWVPMAPFLRTGGLTFDVHSLGKIEPPPGDVPAPRDYGQ